MTNAIPSQQKKNYWRKPNNYIRILTLIFVAGYTVVQIWQTSLVRDANEANSRPYVAVEFNQGSFEIKIPEYMKKKLGINVAVKNTGKTPGFIKALGGLIWTTNHAPRAPGMPEAVNIIGNKFVFPDQNAVTFTILGNELVGGDIVHLQGDQFQKLYVVIDILYGRTSQEVGRYETRVCSSYAITPVEAEKFALKPDSAEPCPDDDPNHPTNYAR